MEPRNQVAVQENPPRCLLFRGLPQNTMTIIVCPSLAPSGINATSVEAAVIAVRFAIPTTERSILKEHCQHNAERHEAKFRNWYTMDWKLAIDKNFDGLIMLNATTTNIKIIKKPRKVLIVPIPIPDSHGKCSIIFSSHHSPLRSRLFGKAGFFVSGCEVSVRGHCRTDDDQKARHEILPVSQHAEHNKGCSVPWSTGNTKDRPRKGSRTSVMLVPPRTIAAITVISMPNMFRMNHVHHARTDNACNTGNNALRNNIRKISFLLL